MATVAEVRSGKGERDENFPVASRLIRARHRPAILAFYRFVRAADDVADHAGLAPDEKLRLLDHLEAALTGAAADPLAEPLRRELSSRGLSPRHARDLLQAFRQDVAKRRYADWDDLIGYCRLSAMPVGRFVLDLHGEPEGIWPVSDDLCAALQIINHLQDCAVDFRRLDRIYIPLNLLATHGADVSHFAAPQSSPALRAVFLDMASLTGALLAHRPALSALVADRRLGLEISCIETMARTLLRRLRSHDPLGGRAGLGKAGLLLAALGGLASGVARQLFGRPHVASARGG